MAPDTAHRRDVDFFSKWNVFANGVKHTVLIAMTMAAIVAIITTWKNTRAFAPTIGIVLVGALAVWAVGHPYVIERLVGQDVDAATEGCLQRVGRTQVGVRVCGERWPEDEDIDQGRDLDLGG